MVRLRSGLSRLSVKHVDCKEFLLALRAFTACLAVLLCSNGELACAAGKALCTEMGQEGAAAWIRDTCLLTGGSVVQNPPASAGEAGSTPGSAGSAREGHGNPL